MSWGAALAGLGQGLPTGIKDAQGLEGQYEAGQEQAADRLAGTGMQLLQALMTPPPQPPQMGPGGMPQAGMSPMPQGGPPMGGQTQQGSGMTMGMGPTSGSPNSFASRFPVASPGGAPIGAEPDIQSMDPNRASGAQALQATMPQGQIPQGGPGMGAMAQMQPQGMQQGGGQQQGGHLDWRTIMMAIHRANPGAPPELMFKAVNKLVPMMNSQSMMEWRQLSAQNAGVRNELTARGQDVRAGTAERGQDVRAATAQGAQEVAKRGQDVRAETQKSAQEGTQKRFDIREARITAHQMVTADQAWQRLDQQRKQAAQKQNITQWRAVLDAQHKRAQEIIGAWSQQNTMPPETRKQLLKDADEAYNTAIKDMGKGDKGSFDQRFQGAGQQSPP